MVLFFIYADDMFRPVQWAIFRSQYVYLRILYSVNHKIGYTKLLFKEISLSFSFPVLYISSLKYGNITYLLVLLSTALQLLVQSFGLLNHFFLSTSILDKGLPIWHFQPLYTFFNIILPAYRWSSRWPL